MPTPLQLAGAHDIKDVRFATIYQNRLFTGLVLQRSPLRDPSQVVYEKYYGGRPDALLRGVNVELTNRLTLARRPGCTQYSTQTFSEAVNSFYAFKQIVNNTEIDTLMVDGPMHLYTLTPAVKTTLYTKGSASNPYGSWMFSVGNSLYISFADSTDQPKAWEGPGATIRNWGIATSGSGASTAKTAGTGTAGAATGGGTSSQQLGPGTASGDTTFGGSFNPWTNPSNILALDGQYASTFIGTDDSPPYSNYLLAQDFGFNLPSIATPVGVVADVWAFGYVNIFQDLSVQLSIGGSFPGGNLANGQLLPPGLTDITYGGPSNLWGTNPAYSDVNDPTFGVAYAVQIAPAEQGPPNEGFLAYVDYIQLTVYYTLPSVSWANPTNIVGAQGHGSPSYTTTTPQTGLNSPSLFATNYGFSLSNQIIGLSVAIYGHVGTGVGTPYLIVQLQDQNANPLGTPKTVNFTSLGDVAVTLGSANDLWGDSPTIGTVNSSNFGVSIIASSSGTTFALNACTVTVYTSAAPAVVTNGSGSLTGAYVYAYSYANTNVTTATGNPVVSNVVGGTTAITLSSALNAAVTVVASSDPQVNTIILWRTVASGSTLFFVAKYPNSSGTIYDNVTNASGTAASTDAQLDTTKQAATAFQLTTPPLNLYGQTWFAGRLWGFVANILYYASGPDLGNIYGSGNEGWPPANYFAFASQITRIVAVVSGLIVFTVSDVWIIQGNASAIGISQSSNATGLVLFNPVPVIADFGLLSPFALDINGSTLYLMTSDNQFVSIDAGAGLSELGFPIGTFNIAYPNDPSLASFNPRNTYVAWQVSGSTEKAIYVSDGSTGWFRCNPNMPPDGGFVWSPKANIVGGCKAVQAIEPAPGVHALLIGPGPGGGPVLVRNLNVFTDNGSPYPANFVMGAISLAEPGQIAEIAFISCDFNRVGLSPIVSILPEELNGTFQNISGYVHSDPPALYGQTGAPTTLYSNRYDLTQSIFTTTGLQNPEPIVCRQIQIEVDFSATDQVQNEMLSVGIFGTLWQER